MHVDVTGPDWRVACRAPFASMYLDQRGYARACAQYDSEPLGHVGNQTLREIWRGPRARELRRRFRDGQWGDGCHLCEWGARSSGEEGVLARNYDRLPVHRIDPEWPVHLELALSNSCNLECIMCTGEQSSRIRRRREGFPALPPAYPDRFFDELRDFLPHLEQAKFLGGEPFLVREHHRVWDLMIELGLETPIHVTTNGTQWNDRVERVLEHLPTSFAISVDGLTPETIARVRVGADPQRVLANLDRFQAYTERRGTYLGLTYCLVTENWHEFADFCAFATDRDLDVYVNTVTVPRTVSLYALEPDELTEVIAGLEARDAWAQERLGRNRGAWDLQLRQLRDHRAARRRGEAAWLTPVHEQLVQVALGAPRASAESDVAVLRSWAEPGPVSVLALDERDTVVAAETTVGRFLDLPMDPRGLSLGDLGPRLVSYYGRMTSTELLHGGDDGYFDRVSRHETPQEATTVRVRTRPAPEGAPGSVQLVFAARREPLTPAGG